MTTSQQSRAPAPETELLSLDPQELLSRALETPHGLAIKVPNRDEFLRLRNKLYRERNTFRWKGDNIFEPLAVVERPGELWIVRKKEGSNRTRSAEVCEARELGASEIPPVINSRGPSGGDVLDMLNRFAREGGRAVRGRRYLAPEDLPSFEDLGI